MKKNLRILPLFLTGLILAGCSSLVKPELAPRILTSAPAATKLRSATIPEGMIAYDSLAAMKTAWQDEDPNLGEMSEIPILDKIPAGMKAVYSASPDEVAVAYQDELNRERNIMIYGYFGEDPDSVLADFGEENYFSGSTIGDRTFHLLTEHADDTNREAYTMEEEWFIHVFASGFTAAEFKDLLSNLKMADLD